MEEIFTSYEPWIHYHYFTMDIANMDTSQVYKKLLSGDLKVKSVQGKSKVWEQFGLVHCGDKEMEFVACTKCNHVLVFKKGKTGTSTMQKHKCSLPNNQPVLTSAVQHLPAKPAKPTTAIKKTVTAACVDFVCEDLRPFDTVAGEGFLDLIQVVSLNTTACL